MVLFFEMKHPAEDDPSFSAKPRHLGKEPRPIYYDPRFPNQNRTKYCFQMYLDFHRCTNKHGQGYDVCSYFERHFQALCPSDWTERWDTQREEGRFPARLN